MFCYNEIAHGGRHTPLADKLSEKPVKYTGKLHENALKLLKELILNAIASVVIIIR